jgi:hypothetical protein
MLMSRATRDDPRAPARYMNAGTSDGRWAFADTNLDMARSNDT